MKSLLGALVVAFALPSLGSDASAANVSRNMDEARAALVAKAGPRHAVTLAKAKKKKRPASSGGGSKANTGGDDSSGGDDDADKSASASSDSGEDAKEDAVLGTSKKKKAPPPVADDSEASGAGGDSPQKSVESVSAKASPEEGSGEGSPASALELGLGAKAMFRQLAWTSDGRAAGLGPYNLTPGPETGLWFEFYPAAFGTSGFASNVGLFGHFNYGFGVATTLANGANMQTSFHDYLAGLKVRIPSGTFTPNVSISYGQQAFEIAQQQNMQDLPKLGYQFIRPAAGARIMFAPTIALDAALGYLLVLDPGSGADFIKSSRFFPKATSYGIDATVSLGVKLAGSIGARAGIDFRQYGLALHPDSTTRAVAGAVDRYIVAWAGLEVVLDGQGAGASDDEPKPSKRRRRHAEPKSDDESSSSDSSSSEDSSSSKSSSDEE
jgi:hypothetical protein